MVKVNNLDVNFVHVDDDLHDDKLMMITMMATMMMITLSPCGQHKHSVVPCKDSSQNRGFDYNAIHHNTI